MGSIKMSQMSQEAGEYPDIIDLISLAWTRSLLLYETCPSDGWMAYTHPEHSFK
ncbi:hypothetical protein ASPZODRAFT_1223669 [Penicilliopsis zonata CBS 506.65]|uniref:Uncharacterized protein n=1 Tax=Penicilliopsis zonata CBS 506.65 TaxID=1073090 RepID=A0A1L9S7L0_9EURO|nr:hypothetical protein ASPZODRAFT_1223669 [Penicilliopsis zonata CBS 506.65]OJJ43133.1 hypothetical protein ASPZODRAFT_1223669 [Penicilliopsis zonata CBS 506.65]